MNIILYVALKLKNKSSYQGVRDLDNRKMLLLMVMMTMILIAVNTNIYRVSTLCCFALLCTW